MQYAGILQMYIVVYINTVYICNVNIYTCNLYM